VPRLSRQVVSWWGPTWRDGSHDTQGVNTDRVLGLVLAEVEQQQELKVAFHLEPYEGELQLQ
jgi:glycoprotein endo-alpha-1,2-mannosidase